MSNDIQKDVLTKTRVVYQKPGIDQVVVQKNLEYKASLTMDVYYPAGVNQECPAVVIVAGYPDQGYQKLLGCKFKETGSSISWAELIAASGIVCITYSNIEPVADFQELLEFIHEHSAELKVDSNEIGLWSSSGNVPLALSALMTRGDLKCAALLYGYMLDSKIDEMSKIFGFVNPIADKSIDNLPQSLPMFIARAGQDQTPYLNEVLDRFILNALQRNMQITFVNHANGPHAFDLFDDGHTTRVIIQEVLDFLNLQLRST
jgi:hypothetical protein